MKKEFDIINLYKTRQETNSKIKTKLTILELKKTKGDTRVISTNENIKSVGITLKRRVVVETKTYNNNTTTTKNNETE